MSNEADTQQGSDGQELPAANTAPDPKPTPRSDAEAAAQESAPDPDKEAKDKEADEKAETEKAERKKNRTREYINRINRENAELRQRMAEAEQSRQAPQNTRQTASDGEPKLEDYDYDVAAFTRAHASWAVSQALKDRDESSKKAESTQRQQETLAAYNEKAADYADDHPDFVEVVGSIAYPLADEIQAAIMAHENGPAIAYHLGNNDDDAFALASIQPHLAAAAVERLATRLTAAPQAPTPAAPAATPTPKPVSQAPAPVPTVSGRSPTETPPEKLTDDAWFERERERDRAKRKRA